MATITRSATSHPTHVLESLKLPRDAIGAAHRADRAGNADGVLTKAELDAFEARNPGHPHTAKLAAALTMPEPTKVKLEDLGGPRIETRPVPGDPSTWISLDELPPEQRKVANALAFAALGGETPLFEKHVDFSGHQVKSLERPIVEWGLRNLDAFFAEGDWNGTESTLVKGLQDLLKTIDAQAEATSERVVVLPDGKASWQRLPMKSFELHLGSEFPFVPDRRGSNKGSIVEQRHLELQGVRNVDVVIQELPDDGASAIGRAAVKKPWEERLPNTQSFAMPPDLRAGRPSRVLIQAFSKDTGEVVESLRLDVPAARRLKNVDLEKMRVESARGTPVYFS